MADQLKSHALPLRSSDRFLADKKVHLSADLHADRVTLASHWVRQAIKILGYSGAQRLCKGMDSSPILLIRTSQDIDAAAEIFQEIFARPVVGIIGEERENNVDHRYQASCLATLASVRFEAELEKRESLKEMTG